MFDVTGLGGIADAVKSITDVVGKFIPDPNIRAQAEVEIKKAVAESQKAQFDAMAQVMSADSNSDSWLTKNARPTVVYWSLTMVTLIAAAGMFGHAKPIIDALSSVPTELWETIKYGIGIFAAGRSGEKIATVVANAIARKK